MLKALMNLVNKLQSKRRHYKSQFFTKHWLDPRMIGLGELWLQTSWWKVNIDFESSSFAQLNKTGVDDKRFGGSDSGSDPSPVAWARRCWRCGRSASAGSHHETPPRGRPASSDSPAPASLSHTPPHFVIQWFIHIFGLCRLLKTLLVSWISSLIQSDTPAELGGSKVLFFLILKETIKSSNKLRLQDVLALMILWIIPFQVTLEPIKFCSKKHIFTQNLLVPWSQLTDVFFPKYYLCSNNDSPLFWH